MSWLEPEREKYAPLFTMRDGEKARIRLLDANKPTKFWVHQVTVNSGKRFEALCAGQQAGCPMCAVNAHPRVAGLENAKKPYPWRAKFIKAVWVHAVAPLSGDGPVQQVNAVKLVSGAEIWRGVSDLWELNGRMDDRDVIIVRKKDEAMGRTKYTTSADQIAPFDVSKIDPLSIPAVSDYFDWFRKNFTVTKLINPDDMDKVGESNWGTPSPAKSEGWPSTLPAAAPATSGFVAPAPEAPSQQPVQTTFVPAQPIAPAAPASSEHDMLVEDMLTTIRKDLDVTVLTDCVKKIVGGAKRELKDLTVEQLKELKPMYLKAMGVK